MIRINLLPRERVRRRPIGGRFLLVLAVVLVLGAMGVSTISLNSRNARVQRELDQVNEQINELQDQVQRVKGLQLQIETARRKEQLLKKLEASRVPWDTVLEELRTVMPQDVWLVQIELKDSGDLVFNGYGMSYEAVARFMVSLESSKLFRDVDMLISQKQTVAGREVVNFSLTGKLTTEQREARIP